MKSYWKITW